MDSGLITVLCCPALNNGVHQVQNLTVWSHQEGTNSWSTWSSQLLRVPSFYSYLQLMGRQWNVNIECLHPPAHHPPCHDERLPNLVTIAIGEDAKTEASRCLSTPSISNNYLHLWIEALVQACLTDTRWFFDVVLLSLCYHMTRLWFLLAF